MAAPSSAAQATHDIESSAITVITMMLRFMNDGLLMKDALAGRCLRITGTGRIQAGPVILCNTLLARLLNAATTFRRGRFYGLVDFPRNTRTTQRGVTLRPPMLS